MYHAKIFWIQIPTPFKPSWQFQLQISHASIAVSEISISKKNLLVITHPVTQTYIYSKN